MSQNAIHFLNGKFVKEADLLISPRDLGFTRGYAVFDFLITYNGKIFKLDEHIDRLFNSADLIRLKIPWSKEKIKEFVKKTLDKNPKGEKTIKIIISGGISEFILPENSPTMIIMIDPRHAYPKKLYMKGMAVKTLKFKRDKPVAKTNNYIEAISNLTSGEKIEDVIYFDDKQVFEATTSNIFAVINHELLTTKSNILPGITRDVLIDILKLNIPLKVRDFNISELRNASEVFLVSSNREIAPVVMIDGKKVGDGKVGKITKEVMRQFNKYTSST